MIFEILFYTVLEKEDQPLFLSPLPHFKLNF